MYYSPAGSYRLSSVNIGVIAGLFSVAFVQRQLFRERTTVNYQPKLRAGVVSAWLWRVMKKSIRPKQFPLKSYFHILSSLVHIISPYLSAYLCYEFYHLKVKVSQSCPTLCDPMDYTAHRILQARILEEVAFPFANPEIEPRCPAMQVDSLPAELLGKLKEMATYSSILAWRISWTEEAGGLQSIESQRVGHD